MMSNGLPYSSSPPVYFLEMIGVHIDSVPTLKSFQIIFGDFIATDSVSSKKATPKLVLLFAEMGFLKLHWKCLIFHDRPYRG